ncbi:TRAP transporter large permease [Salipiger sp. P9]|uniref:TRAP transporter large permease n=1 Tax=Salipiger pentaromativorans TaxID=2943193 RepID=UPI0021574A0B|nr:TRAP transporter large permease [Salipiger pentaromativorans]MCR8547403.1 TRAP transporter large permease [Salipiger pentaromativorans]
MDRETVTLVGFAALFFMMAIRVPIAIAMSLVGIGGFAAVVGLPQALKLVSLSPLSTATTYHLGMIPMFILMGAFATRSGMSRELFRSAEAWLGHRRGGLALATIASCAGFAAISGSSIATAATLTKVALPEMRRVGYSDSVSSGVIAAGGTVGILIPPSIVLAVYGIITEQDIGKLFIAGLLPGLLAVGLYMLTVSVIAHLRPADMPVGQRQSWAARFRALREVWAIGLLFLLVVGGIYAGIVTPTEASALGAVGALAIGVLRGRLDRQAIMECLIESLRISISIFFVFIGALLFSYFLAITRTPQNVAEYLTNLEVNRYVIMALILLLYLALGCVLDSMAMVVLTVPILFPVVTGLGFDPIWFGVMVVVAIELGLITPPIGMNVFVINSVERDIGLATIYRGLLPFIAIDILRMGLMLAFPAIALFLPGLM